ncbi:DM13 domain-containing protein [Deinococcus sp.]|uniref:DM13 domain-containing protein n=1 Tax=Deinococcus sp. TaxID=47478 RepID=UPI003B5A44D5
MTIRNLTILTLTALLGASIGTVALATADPAKPADPAMSDSKDGTMKDGEKDGAMMEGAMKDGAKGTFRSLEAPTTGTVTWTKSGENYILKVSNLKTEAAPDLQVWLYQGDVKAADEKLKVPGKYVTVGTLKTFGGDFTYTVPASKLGKDMAKFNSVVLWCDQVATAFAIANLK